MTLLGVVSENHLINPPSLEKLKSIHPPQGLIRVLDQMNQKFMIPPLELSIKESNHHFGYLLASGFRKKLVISTSMVEELKNPRDSEKALQYFFYLAEHTNTLGYSIYSFFLAILFYIAFLLDFIALRSITGLKPFTGLSDKFAVFTYNLFFFRNRDIYRWDERWLSPTQKPTEWPRLMKKLYFIRSRSTSPLSPYFDYFSVTPRGIYRSLLSQKGNRQPFLESRLERLYQIQ